MKNLRKVLLVLSIFILVAGFSACGQKSSDNGSDAANSATNATASDSSAAVVDTKDIVAAPESVSTVDDVLGTWVDLSDSTRSVTITKLETGCQYEDSEGKYPADFKEGILQVKVADDDIADVYLDKETGNLISNYHGDITKYKKK